jgi:hypothetical protein
MSEALAIDPERTTRVFFDLQGPIQAVNAAFLRLTKESRVRLASMYGPESV